MQLVQVNIKQIVKFSDSSGAQTSFLTEAWEFQSIIYRSFYVILLTDLCNIRMLMYL